MGCKIITGKMDGGDVDAAVFYCSNTMRAFGPVMGSPEEAEAFAEWLTEDPRDYSRADLTAKHAEFVQLFVCECGQVRCTDCGYCADALPLVDGMHQWTEDMGANVPPLTMREPCNADLPPADGERFQCRHCRELAARKAALKKGRHGQPHSA